MIIILSPAKTIREQVEFTPKELSKPLLLKEAEWLMKELRKVPEKELKRMMALSDKLALRTMEMTELWSSKPATKLPAALVFDGEAYRGLQADSFTEEDFQFAQKHLRILSGLYGVLRPLDLISPYRLEMGIKWRITSFSNLYQYWGERITKEIFSSADGVIINLASNEYAKAVNLKAYRGQVITPIFKDFKNGSYQTVMMYAKHARGAMSRFIIWNRITNPEDLKGFDTDGYGYDANLSTENEWVFTR